MSTQAMPRLLKYFASVFSNGLSLDEGAAVATTPAAIADVYVKLRSLVEQGRVAALAAGKPPQQVESAVSAVVACLDEILARKPASWNAATPLQLVLFSNSNNNVGNESFLQVNEQKLIDEEAREVYHHVLLLGFAGPHQFEAGERDRLDEFREPRPQQNRQQPVAPAPLQTLREEYSAQQQYSASTGSSAPSDRWLLKIGAGVVLLIAVLCLAYVFLKPKETGAVLAQRVNQQLTRYVCSDLSAAVDDDGVTAVKGFVSKSEEVARVQTDITAIKGVKNPTFDLAVRTWPNCEVASLLKGYRASNLELHQGLEVTPTTGHSNRFIDEEYLTAKLRQANYDGYLYVDYYNFDGTVYHLFPNKDVPDSYRVILSGETFVVGQKDHTWQVGPPFGQEVITVISSQVPLYSADRPEYEHAAVYLAKLHDVLEANRSNNKLAANFLFMQTEAKQ